MSFKLNNSNVRDKKWLIINWTYCLILLRSLGGGLVELDYDAGHVVAAQSLTLMHRGCTILLKHHFNHRRKSFKFAVVYRCFHLSIPLTWALRLGALSTWIWTWFRWLLRQLQVYLRQLQLAFDNKVAGLLTSHAVPDPVTGTNNKVWICRDRSFWNFGKSRNRHFIRWQRSWFELPVTQSATNCYHSIDSPVFNVVSGCHDSWFFCWHVWLMILR